MKVHIITEGNWIKKFWSDKIIEYNKTDIEYSISTEPRQDVDVNFYICFNTYLLFNKTNALDIGYVTHIHNNSPEAHSRDTCISFDKFKEMDAWIHQSKRSLNQFINLGYPEELNFNVTSAVEVDKFKPTIKLGIFQNGEVVGKGLHFMEDLVKSHNLSNFKFIFCGRGWESVIKELEERQVRYEVHNYTPEEYHEVAHKVLYEKIDYLLVPSLWEGGPVAPEEAMACGIPIISSDVGLIPEFNVEYMFPAGDIHSLMPILNKIEKEVLDRRQKVLFLTYENFNNRIYSIFKKLINKD